MKGSPSNQEKSKYPADVVVLTNKKAWSNGDTWLNFLKHFNEQLILGTKNFDD